MFAILTLAIIFLWYSQTQNTQELKQDISTIQDQIPTLSPPATASAGADLTTIQSSLDTLTLRLDKLEGIPSPTPITTTGSKPAPFQKQVLTLGSSSTTNLNWVPTGLEITINSADYPSSVMAYFEAGLNCPGGLAWARLTNKTTGAIINISEVSHNTNTVTYKRSPDFKLHSGNNNYVVEMRSTSGEVAYLSSSRIVIEKP